MNILNADEFAHYVKTGGMECPFCGSKEVSWRDEVITEDDSTASQEVECDDCKKKWIDHYALQYVEIEPDDSARRGKVN